MEFIKYILANWNEFFIFFSFINYNMSNPYARPENISNEWIETDTSYARREDSKGYVVSANEPGNLIYYQKKIHDISGRNNHMWIGPEYINPIGVEYSRFASSKIYYGTLNSGKLYDDYDNSIRGVFNDITIATKSTFLLYDYSQGEKWWRSDRWHKNQLYYYNHGSYTVGNLKVFNKSNGEILKLYYFKDDLFGYYLKNGEYIIVDVQNSIGDLYLFKKERFRINYIPDFSSDNNFEQVIAPVSVIIDGDNEDLYVYRALTEGTTYQGGAPNSSKLHVNLESYISDPIIYINLKNTERHYENSTSIVSQFSDAYLYDFTETSANSKQIQKRIGWYEHLYVSLWLNTNGSLNRVTPLISGMSARRLEQPPEDSNGNRMDFDINNQLFYSTDNNSRWFQSNFNPTEIIVNDDNNVKQSSGNPSSEWPHYRPSNYYFADDYNYDGMNKIYYNFGNNDLPQYRGIPKQNTHYFDWKMYTWQTYIFDLFDTSIEGGNSLNWGVKGNRLPHIIEFSTEPNAKGTILQESDGISYELDNIRVNQSDFYNNFSSSTISAKIFLDPSVIYDSLVESNGMNHVYDDMSSGVGCKYLYYHIRKCTPLPIPTSNLNHIDIGQYNISFNGTTQTTNVFRSKYNNQYGINKSNGLGYLSVSSGKYYTMEPNTKSIWSVYLAGYNWTINSVVLQQGGINGWYFNDDFKGVDDGNVDFNGNGITESVAIVYTFTNKDYDTGNGIFTAIEDSYYTINQNNYDIVKIEQNLSGTWVTQSEELSNAGDMGWYFNYAPELYNNDGPKEEGEIHKVTVDNGVYKINGQDLTDNKFEIYNNIETIINLDDSSNNGHPFLLSFTNDGTHNNGQSFEEYQTVEYRLSNSSTNMSNWKNNFDSHSSRRIFIKPKTSNLNDMNLHYYCHNHSGMGSTYNGGIRITSPSLVNLIYKITVESFNGSNKYFIGDNIQGHKLHSKLNIYNNTITEFNLDDSSNNTHPFSLSLTHDGTHTSGGVFYITDKVKYFLDDIEYTNFSDWQTNFTGASKRRIKIYPQENNIILHYFCAIHPAMGSDLNGGLNITEKIYNHRIKYGCFKLVDSMPFNRSKELFKGIFFNKYSARFAHPLTVPGEGIKTMYIVYDIWRYSMRSIDSKDSYNSNKYGMNEKINLIDFRTKLSQPNVVKYNTRYINIYMGIPYLGSQEFSLKYSPVSQNNTGNVDNIGSGFKIMDSSLRNSFIGIPTTGANWLVKIAIGYLLGIVNIDNDQVKWGYYIDYRNKTGTFREVDYAEEHVGGHNQIFNISDNSSEIHEYYKSINNDYWYPPNHNNISDAGFRVSYSFDTENIQYIQYDMRDNSNMDETIWLDYFLDEISKLTINDINNAINYVKTNVSSFNVHPFNINLNDPTDISGLDRSTETIFIHKLDIDSISTKKVYNDRMDSYLQDPRINRWYNIDSTNEKNHTKDFTNFIYNKIDNYWSDSNYWSIEDDVMNSDSDNYNNSLTLGNELVKELISRQRTPQESQNPAKDSVKEWPERLGLHNVIPEGSQYYEFGGPYSRYNVSNGGGIALRYFRQQSGLSIPSMATVGPNNNAPGLKWQLYGTDDESYITKETWLWRYPNDPNAEAEFDERINSSIGNKDTTELNSLMYLTMGKPFLAIDDVNTQQEFKYELVNYSNKVKIRYISFKNDNNNFSSPEEVDHVRGSITSFVGISTIIKVPSDLNILISATEDGTHQGGTIYNSGVVYLDFNFQDVLTETEYINSLNDKYIIFTPNENTNLYYYDHNISNAGGSFNIIPQRPYYKMREERDKFWNIPNEEHSIATGQIVNFDNSGSSRKLLNMSNWKSNARLSKDFYKYDPRHFLMSVIYVYKKSGDDTIYFHRGYDGGIYEAEKQGFICASWMDTPIYTQHKYVFLFPEKMPGNADNPMNGENMNGETNDITKDKFKLMHEGAYASSTYGGDASEMYLGEKEGFVIHPTENKIEFTPIDNLVCAWNYEYDILGKETNYQYYNYFSIDNSSNSSQISLNRKYDVDYSGDNGRIKYDNDLLVEYILKPLINYAKTTSSKENLLSYFNNKIKGKIISLGQIQTLPSIFSKTVPYGDVEAQKSRFIHTSNNNDYLYMNYNGMYRRTSLGSSEGIVNRMGYWIDDKDYDPNIGSSNIENLTGFDTIDGGKLILTLYHKTGRFPNQFNLLGGTNIYQQPKYNGVLTQSSHTLEGTSAGVNEIIVFDSLHSDETKRQFIKKLNQTWQVYKTDSSSSYVDYNPLGSYISNSISIDYPTTNIGNKLFHYKGNAKNIAGANTMIPDNGQLVQEGSAILGFNTNILNYTLIVAASKSSVSFNITPVDVDQPTMVISDTTGLVVGVPKLVSITSYSESMMTSVVYNITVSRRSQSEEADFIATGVFGDATNQPEHPINKIKNFVLNKNISSVLDDSEVENYIKNNITGTESEKRTKRKAQLKILLANVDSNIKSIKIKPDAFNTSDFPSNITSVSVFKPSVSDNIQLDDDVEAAYIPLHDGDETAIKAKNNSEPILIKCISSENNGNFSIVFPNISYVNINKPLLNDNLITSVEITNLKFNDRLNIEGKNIKISSVTYTGNSGTIRITDINQFNDISNHLNQVIRINNNFFQMNLNPSSYQNFWQNSTFWSNTNISSYNTGCNITYDNENNNFELYNSAVQTAHYNITGTASPSQLIYKQNLNYISDSLSNTIGSSTSLYKNTRDITVSHNNTETYGNLNNIYKTNKENKYENSLDKTIGNDNITINNLSNIISDKDKNSNIHSNKSTFVNSNQIIEILANSSLSMPDNTSNSNINLQNKSSTINGNKLSNKVNDIINIHNNLNIPDTNNLNINIYGDNNKSFKNYTSEINNNSTVEILSDLSTVIKTNSNNFVNQSSSTFLFNKNTTISNNINKLIKLDSILKIDGIKNSNFNNLNQSFNSDSNINIHGDNSVNITGDLKQYTNNSLITTNSNNIRSNHLLDKKIHGTHTTLTNLKQDSRVNNYNVNVSGNYDIILEDKHHINTSSFIKLKSSGGLQISSNINHSLQLNSNVGISNSSIISNVPYNLTTSVLSSYINDSGTETSVFVIDPVYSFVLITLDTNNSIAESYMTKNLYIRFNLKPGKYNGQQIKIALHPVYQTFFNNVSDSSYNSINKRLSHNISTDIIIRIDSLCDTNTNEFVTADLILNRGGMCLNLLYVDTNDNHPISTSNNINHYRNSGITTTGSGYWMLIGNSFTS